VALSDKVDVRIAKDGVSLQLPTLIGRNFTPESLLRIASQGADALVLLREELATNHYLVGTLGAFSLGELFGHLLTGAHSGTLIVSAGDSRRAVDFRDGQMVFASSSEPYERLGMVLVKHGWLSPEQLDAALSKVKTGVKIGQVLLRSKAISAATLYAAMTGLVREIVINLFELSEGDFLFLEGASPSEDALKLPQSTRSIVLDGIKRAEALDRLRKKLPPSTRVSLGKGQAPEGAHGLLAKIGGGGELGALRILFDGSEHAFLQRVETCLASEALVPQAAAKASTPRPPESVHGSALQLYGSLIQTICRALKTAGQDLSDLQSFLKDPLPGMEEAFAGVQLSSEGELDVTRVINNLGDTPVRRAKAYEALDSFMSYALFSAKNVMPSDAAEALAKECRQMQAGLRQ
jgi:hypothetical protein